MLFDKDMHIYINNYFLLKQLILEQEKFECLAGLEPASLGVWPSAFTFRPPALFAPRCSLTLIRELPLCPIP